MRNVRHLTGLSAVVALALAGCVATSKAAPAEGSAPAPQPAFATIGKDGRPVSDVADVVQKVLPSVVSVWSSRTERVEQPMSPFQNDPFFRRFFGPMREGPREFKQQGLGSGVVIEGGYIVTNNHVIDHADEVRVTGANEHEYQVKLVGADPKSDLAVFKIQGDSTGLTPVGWGSSTRLRLGEVVLAIGNPFGVGETVTMGIVSAKGRADLGIEEYEDFIQTDAAINPGNSGGALVDARGQLVGINTAIYSQSGGSMGIGFAIPSDMARPIIKSLIDHGRVSRGYLGIEIQEVTRDLAEAMHLPNTDGVLVGGVAPGGSAAKAGIRGGDVILEVQGRAVNSTGQLRNAVAAAGGGSKVELTILRDGKRIKLGAVLAEMPAKEAKQARTPNGGDAASDSLTGVALAPLDGDSRAKLHVPDSVKGGVVVADVQDESPAARAGLRPGDVIRQVDRKDVSSVGEVESAARGAKGGLLLLVFRDGFDRFVVVKR